MLRFLFTIIVVSVLIFIGGFLWFIFDVPKTSTTEKVDAVVVLTGGNGRIEEGLTLLREDAARMVYISGVNSNVSDTQLQQSHKISAKEMDCCIRTDKSQDTRTNALETAKWAEENNIRTMRLVTSSYHMRRSLLEFRSLLPETVILPTPVSVTKVYGQNWWKDQTIWEKLGQEYLKYLVVQFRQFEEAFGRSS